MCKAHILRFSCGHGVLMSIEPCKLGPCPMIKTCGDKLPSQPSRCHNCQQKAELSRSRDGSTTSTGTIFSVQRASTFPPSTTSYGRRQSSYSPNTNSTPFCTKLQRRHSERPFTFTCSTSKHPLTPHYSNLPIFLPHQDHPCPPCQLNNLRSRGESETLRQAHLEHPKLTQEMLIRNGCIKEWQAKPTLGSYVDERLTEEREMWHHVTRKWTQDLKRCRVLVSEEDGLGLLS